MALDKGSPRGALYSAAEQSRNKEYLSRERDFAESIRQLFSAGYTHIRFSSDGDMAALKSPSTDAPEAGGKILSINPDPITNPQWHEALGKAISNWNKGKLIER